MDFHDENRTNETHRSITDPEARLYKKSGGAPARLCYLGHVLMENRNGPAVGARLTQATGMVEREACLELIEEPGGSRRITLGVDKAYGVRGHMDTPRSLKVTPHVAQNNTGRKSTIDRRTTRHPGYTVSMDRRKRAEIPPGRDFGWVRAWG